MMVTYTHHGTGPWSTRCLGIRYITGNDTLATTNYKLPSRSRRAPGADPRIGGEFEREGFPRMMADSEMITRISRFDGTYTESL